MESALFRDLAFVLVAALVGGASSVLFRLPLLTGYIVAGVIFAGLSNILQAGSEVLQLAQLGIILLLFTLGIELTFTRIAHVFHIAVFGGLIQILVTVLFGLFVLPAFGITGIASLVLAFGFSLSSTAVVVKLLQEKGEVDTVPGGILTGWLLVQDLSVIPVVVLLPILAGQGGGVGDVILALGKAGSLLVGAIVAGRFFVPKIMNWLVKTNSREFFLLGIVTFVFVVATVVSLFGISPALGAFLAGLVVSETSQNHAVFAEIRPLRELFMILFFVSLGALVQPSFLLASWNIILALTLLFLFMKFFTSFVVTLFFGYHAKNAFFTALGLANVGEFSFLVAAIGGGLGILSAGEVGIAVSVTLLTLLITPLLFSIRNLAWQRTKQFLTLPLLAKMNGVDHRVVLPAGELVDHVVLCGFGRIGSWLGRACQLAHIPFVVIDYNHDVVRELIDRGIPYVYGDPADREVLEVAGVRAARLLVIAVPDRHTQELVIGHTKTLNPKIPIISRAHQEIDRVRLLTLGVSSVIQPEFEAALSIAHRIFQTFGMSKEEVAGRLKTIKAEHTRVGHKS